MKLNDHWLMLKIFKINFACAECNNNLLQVLHYIIVIIILVSLRLRVCYIYTNTNLVGHIKRDIELKYFF